MSLEKQCPPKITSPESNFKRNTFLLQKQHQVKHKHPEYKPDKRVEEMFKQKYILNVHYLSAAKHNNNIMQWAGWERF